MAELKEHENTKTQTADNAPKARTITIRTININTWPVYITTAAIIIGIIGFLIGRSISTHKPNVPAQTAAQTPKAEPAEAPAKPSAKPTDPWYGQPAPTPAYWARRTEEYQNWRIRFDTAMTRLAKAGHPGLARDLNAWVIEFEKREGERAQQNFKNKRISYISKSFRNPVVHRLIGAPPAPAFAMFYGYKVELPWDHSVYYYEANAIPKDSPYLLHENGIKDGGTSVRRRKDIHMLLAQAGITDPVAINVLIKTSGLEGGFEAVNTWDTGSVSVGFIQFTTGESAEGHSLVAVLTRMKENENTRILKHQTKTNQFKYYFTNRGIDVRGGQLYIIDPYTRRVLTGEDAVNLIIKDKRITALFQDAGAKSKAFQIAQIQIAHNTYYLADRTLSVPVAEVAIYQTTQPKTTEASTTAPAPTKTLLKKRYVYGTEAITAEEALQGSAADTNNGITREIAKLPNMVGLYRDILPSETGRLALTDRAVQHGVKSALATVETAINTTSHGEHVTFHDLRLRENELIANIRNRIQIPTAKQANATEPTKG